MFENTLFWSIFTVILNVLIWSYIFLKKKYSYWSKQGVTQTPSVPFLGDMLTRMTADMRQLEITNAAKYGKVYGCYLGLTPVLVTSDPELIKHVMIKDFGHFVNRFKFNAYHEMWNQNLLFSEDDKWKRIRTITTPSFTTGKLRAMHSLMNRCVANLVTFLDNAADQNGGIIDTKTVISGFTMDVIASTAFATETNANFETNQQTGFIAMGKRMFDQKPAKAMAIMMLPKFVLNLFGLDHPFHSDAFEFFINLTKHIVKDRRQTGSTRNDLVQMLLDASAADEDMLDYEKLSANEEIDTKSEPKKFKSKTSSQNKLTDSEVIANCIFFLLAGYETTGSTISHCLFSLAHNPDIQERLHAEITKALASLDDEQSTEFLETIMTKIPYLEAVIKETLRHYPPVTAHSRICNTNNYHLGDIVLQKDQFVAIAITAVHFNPDYFPDPWKFNPDRFMPENKANLVPYTYIPFGLGPRNCVGMHFAYQEIKLCLAHIIRRYQFVCAPDTPAKLIFKKGNSLLNANKFPLMVVKRN